MGLKLSQLVDLVIMTVMLVMMMMMMIMIMKLYFDKIGIKPEIKTLIELDLARRQNCSLLILEFTIREQKQEQIWTTILKQLFLQRALEVNIKIFLRWRCQTQLEIGLQNHCPLLGFVFACRSIRFCHFISFWRRLNSLQRTPLVSLFAFLLSLSVGLRFRDTFGAGVKIRANKIHLPILGWTSNGVSFSSNRQLGVQPVVLNWLFVHFCKKLWPVKNVQRTFHFQQMKHVIGFTLHNAYIEQLKFLAVVCAWTVPQKCHKIHNGTYLFPGANNSEENREN